jgi:hypothetical protein
MIDARFELVGAPESGAELDCGGTVSPVSDTPVPITALAVSDGELVDTFDPSP